METSEKLITENLDVWTSAVKAKSRAGRGSSNKRELYGIQKLRELILKLAVTGKLVEQDPEDDSSSIQTRVGEHVSFQNGYAFKSTWYQEEGIRVCRNANVGHGCLDWTEEKRVDRTMAKELERFSLADGDIVLSLDRPLINTGLKIARLTTMDLPCLLLQRVAKPIPDQKKVRPDFLYMWFHSPAFTNFIDPGRSNGVPHISTKQVQNIRILLPPLAEQHRIVAKVDELMALCDQLEQEQESNIAAHDTLVATLLNALTETTAFAEAWERIQANFDTLFTTESSIDQLKQTILQLAVMGKLVEQDPEDEPAEGIIENIRELKNNLYDRKVVKKPKRLVFEEDRYIGSQYPDTWWVGPCDEISTKITDGEHATPIRQESGHYLLSARNVRDGHIDTTDIDCVGDDEFARIRKRCDPEKNDVLLSCSGSVGRVALVDEDGKYAMVRSAALIKISTDYLVSKFIMFALQSPELQRQIEEGSKKSAQANLFIEPIRRLAVPIPPLAEQHRIVAKVDELMSLCDQLKASLATAQATQLNLADSLVEQAVS